MEVRIVPTYEVAANVFGPLQVVSDFPHLNAPISWIADHEIERNLNRSLLDSYTGLTLIKGELFLADDVHKDQRIYPVDPDPVISPPQSKKGRKPSLLKAQTVAVRVACPICSPARHKWMGLLRSYDPTCFHGCFHLMSREFYLSK